MRKEIFGVLLLTLLCGSSNVTGNISGVVKKILSPFFHQHKSEEPVTVTTIEINDDTADVTQALLEIWDIIRELFEDQVLNVENKIGQKLRFEASFTSFHTNQFHLFKEKFTKQYVEKQNYKEVLKYFIPLLKHLKSYYREKCHAEFANSSTERLVLYEFYSFANEIMSEIVYLFKKKSTDSSVFKVKTIQKELKIITKGNFKVNLTKNDLKIVHDRLVTIKNKHLETLERLKTSTGATNCQVGTQTEAHAFLNVWTSIRDLIYSQVQLIQRSGASLLECQKDFLSFYKEQYATFSQYLDALPISASSPRDRAKYLLPLLSQLQILYRQESLTTEQVTTTTTTTTSSTQSSLRTFSSYAYQSISQVLSVFQSKCSDQSIFSSSESVIDLATVSQSGFSVDIAASDLTSVYEILELLRERQLKVAGIAAGTTSGSSIAPIALRSARAFLNVWTSIRDLIYSQVQLIQRSGASLLECQKDFLSFYKEQYATFSQYLDALPISASSPRDRAKYLLPLLSQLQILYRQESLTTEQVTTTTTTTTSSTQSSLRTFSSYAYQSISQVLSVFQSKCSDQSIFSSSESVIDLATVSQSGFSVDIAASDLTSVYEILELLRERQLKVAGIAAGTTSGSSIAPIALRSARAFLNVWTSIRDLIYSQVQLIQRSGASLLECQKDFLSFYKEQYATFSQYLDALPISASSPRDRAKYLLLLLSQLQILYRQESLTTEQVTTTTTTTTSSTQSSLRTFSSYAYQSISQVLSVFQSKCSDQSIFSSSESVIDLATVSQSGFSVDIAASDLTSVYEILELLRERQLKVAGIAAGTTSGSSIAPIALRSARAFLNVWTSIRDLIYSQVQLIQRSGASLLECQKDFLSFYKEQYATFSQYLDALPISASSPRDRAKYLLPLLSQLQILYRQESLTTEQVTTTTTTTTSSTQSSLRTFSSYAYQSISQVLSVFQSKCSDQSIFSSSESVIDLATVSQSGFSVDIAASDLTSVYEILELLRERQLKVAGIAAGTTSGSSIAPIALRSARAFLNVWTSIRDLIYSQVQLIQRSGASLLECQKDFLSFYKEQYATFSQYLDALPISASSPRDRAKYLLPLLSQLQILYRQESLTTEQVTTTTTTTTSSTQSSLRTFSSYAYQSISQVLSVFQSKCSDQSIFSSSESVIDLATVSQSGFSVDIAASDLTSVYEILELLRERQLKVAGIAAGTTSGSSIAPIALRSARAFLNVWTSIRDLIYSQVQLIQRSGASLLECQKDFLSFYKEQYATFSQYLDALPISASSPRDRAKYLLPLLSQLQILYRQESLTTEQVTTTTTTTTSSTQSSLRTFSSYAYQSISQVLSVFQSKCSDQSIFSSSESVIDLATVSQSGFSVDIAASDLTSVYEILELLRERQLKVAGIAAGTTSGSSIAPIALRSARAFLNVWTSIRDLIYSQVQLIQRSGASLLECQKDFLSFYKEQYATFSQYLDALPISASSPRDRAKYLLPLLSQLQILYRQESLTTEQVTTTTTTTTSSTQSSLRTFSSYAYQSISQVLSVFQSKCSDQSIFSSSESVIDLATVSQSGFSVDIAASDLTSVYEILELLRERQLKVAGIAAGTTSGSSIAPIALRSARAFLNVWTSIRDLIYSQVQLIQRSGASLLECQKDFLSFYKEQYATFSQYLDALPISASSPRDRAKYLLPLLSQLQILYRQESLTTEQVTTTTTTTTSSTQSSLRTFSSYAYQSISQVLSVFQSKCSDQSIFSSSESVIDLATVSQSGFSVDIAASDLTSVYEILELLRERQLKVAGIAAGTTSGSSIAPIALRSARAFLNVWTSIRDLIYSQVQLIQRSGASLLECQKDFLSFYKEQYATFSQYLDALPISASSPRDRAKYLLPLLSQLQILYRQESLTTEQVTTTTTTTTSSTQSSLRTFSSYAYQSISQVLSVFQSKCSDQSIFSSSESVIDLATVSQSGFSVDIAASDLTSVYEILELLRERQLKVAGIAAGTTSGSSIAPIALRSARAFLNVWTSIRDLIYSQVQLIQRSGASLLECQKDFLSFYKEQYATFSQYLDALPISASSPRDRAKYLLPLLSQLQILYRQESLTTEQVTTTTTTTTSSTQSSLRTFSSYAYQSISQVLSVFQSKCSDQSIFSSSESVIDLATVSQSGFSVDIAASDLTSVYEILELLRERQLKVAGIAAGTTSGSSIAPIALRSARAFLNVWTSIRDLIYSQVQLIQRSGASLLECQKDFLSFYKEQYATFSQYLDALPISASSPRDRAKYLLPLLSQLQILYRQESLTTEQVTTTTTTTTSSTQSSLRTFSSYAYQSISQVLSVFQSKCSDQSIFSSSESVIDLATVSQSGFSVNVAASDLTSVYEILELLRERQSLVLKNYSSLTIVRSDIAEKFDWKIRTKINSLFELYNRGVQSLIAHTPLEDLNKVGVSITTLLQKLISYHDNFLLFDLDGLKLGSVDYMRSRLVLDQKIQAILLQLLNDFIEWKDDVVALKTGSGVLSTCVMKCHPEILLN